MDVPNVRALALIGQFLKSYLTLYLTTAGNEPSPMFRSRRSGSDDLDDLESEADSVVPIVRRMRSRTLPLQMLAQPPIGFGQVRNYEG